VHLALIWMVLDPHLLTNINKSEVVINGGIGVMEDFHILLMLRLKVSIKGSHF